MRTFWSGRVQGIKTLYLSRKLRFDDVFFPQYQKIFALDPDAKLRILEVGCGPGALAEALLRRYPAADVTGIDRDETFISFAKETVKGAAFLTGDAAALPFADDTFDVTVSYTVQEHVEPAAFWGEQLRVLRPGGVCLCMSARRGPRCVAPCLAETAAEKAFWAGVEDDPADFPVCRYPATEAELPALMERYGFRRVTTGYAVADLTPDDPKYPAETALAMIEADRQCDLEALLRAGAPGTVIAAVNEKYDARVRLYRDGIRQWDAAVSLTMVVRGEKPRTG